MENMKSRNNLVEFERFLFSMLVIGYHVQASFLTEKTDFFEWGALAVEFFFILTGFFFASSVEKSCLDEGNFLKKSGLFIGKKVVGVLPEHIIAIVAVLIVIGICDASSFVDKLLNGLPSVFFVQMFVIWDSSFSNALIVPEWYISSMLVCLLFMTPIAFALRRKIKGVLVSIVLVVILVVILVIGGFSFNWAFPMNFIYNLRAWGEMFVGMFAFYLAKKISSKETDCKYSAVLKVLEIVLYTVPVLLGIIPLDSYLSFVGMIVAVVCVFFAICITFSGNGIQISNKNVNKVFGFLGSISLATYLFHPIIIELIDYVYIDVAEWVKYLIVFSSTIVLSILYKLIANLIKATITRKRVANNA